VGRTAATGIDDRGRVVAGPTSNAGSPIPFLWQNLTRRGVTGHVSCIDNRGRLIGTADANGSTQVVMYAYAGGDASVGPRGVDKLPGEPHSPVILITGGPVNRDVGVDWETQLRLTPGSFAPLYAQLADRLRTISAELAPGTLMPSEKELMEYAKVSRATARSAVADLVREGLLVSHRGRGTFTARPRVATDLNRPRGFSETMRFLGHTPSTRVLGAVELPASTDIADRLAVPVGTPVIQVERLRLVGDEPCMIERTHLVAASVPGLLQCDLSESLYDLLRLNWGLYPVRGQETIIAVNADREAAKLLGVPLATALLATMRSTESADGRPLEYTLRHARGDMCSFAVDLSASSALAATGQPSWADGSR
jgi:GntR family transcriptional regulator